MRSLNTLVGFVLILGLLTLGVVGLDYLTAPVALQLAFAILLAAFGLLTFGVAIMSRPSAGSIFAMAGAAIALFVAVRDTFMGTLDLLLFGLVIFDVIVLFVLFGEIDRSRMRHRRAHRRMAATRTAAPATSVAKSPAKKAPAAKKASAKKAPAKKKPAKKASTKKRAAKKAPAKKAAVKKASRKAPAKKASTRTSAAASSVAHRFVASKNREGSAFHLVNCYVAQRIDNDERAHFVTREQALEAGHSPCRICNP